MWKANYRRVSIVVLNQFLRVSRKFENTVTFVKILVRSLSWDFFPSYFFYSFYQILIRSWDVELHTKFQPHKIFFEGVIQYFPFLKTVWKFLYPSPTNLKCLNIVLAETVFSKTGNTEFLLQKKNLWDWNFVWRSTSQLRIRIW